MNVNVLDIFYENIVPEATTGRIDCNFYYNMVFSTKIIEKNIEYNVTNEDYNLLIPTLIIKNKDLFDKLLIEYVDLAMNFYDSNDSDIDDYKMYDNKKKICQEKVILALLFANATNEDFNNPCDYIMRRINYIKSDVTGVYDLGESSILKGNVFLEIDKDIINNETPYQMIIKIVSNNGEEFEFPRIKFGISDDTVYIYAIQNELYDSNSFSKKINRILYKVGEGYNQEYDVDAENLKDVTSSFLVSLNMGISFFNKLGYNKIVVPAFLIERWNAKSIANSFKAKFKKLGDTGTKLLFDEQDYIQRNLTNKLIRTFLRLGCHYNNIDVLSFPSEIDSYLHLYINDNNLRCNNTLLYETYMLVQNGVNSKHR